MTLRTRTETDGNRQADKERNSERQAETEAQREGEREKKKRFVLLLILLLLLLPAGTANNTWWRTLAFLLLLLRTRPPLLKPRTDVLVNLRGQLEYALSNLLGPPPPLHDFHLLPKPLNRSCWLLCQLFAYDPRPLLLALSSIILTVLLALRIIHSRRPWQHESCSWKQR